MQGFSSSCQRVWPAAGALLVGCASPSPSTLAPARGPLRASFSEETDPRPSKFLQPPGPISSCPGRHSLSLARMEGKLLCSVAGMSLAGLCYTRWWEPAPAQFQLRPHSWCEPGPAKELFPHSGASPSGLRGRREGRFYGNFLFCYFLFSFLWFLQL